MSCAWGWPRAQMWLPWSSPASRSSTRPSGAREEPVNKHAIVSMIDLVLGAIIASIMAIALGGTLHYKREYICYI